MYELSLAEAHSLAKRVYFLLLKVLLLVVTAFQRILFVNRQAERDLALDDHIKALGDVSSVVNDRSLVVHLQLQVLIDVSNEFVLLDWVLQNLLEYVQGFEALLEGLASEVQLHEGAIAVGRPLLLPRAGTILDDFYVPEVNLLQELLFLHVNYIGEEAGGCAAWTHK